MAELILPEWFKGARTTPCHPHGGGAGGHGGRAVNARFLDKTLSSFAAAVSMLISTGAEGNGGGLLKRVTPRARILGAFILVLAAAVAGSWVFLLSFTGFIALIAAASGVRPFILAKRVLPAFVLTFVIVIPVFFFSGGAELFGVEVNGFRIAVTDIGIKTALFFVTRVVAMVSAVMLLVLTTAESDFFRGLRGLPVPTLFVTALYMTRRYLVILLKTAGDAALARKSRTIDAGKVKDPRGWFSSRAALLLQRSLRTAEDVTMAMASRGFTGRFKTFSAGRLSGGDLVWIGCTSFIFFLSLGL